MPKILVVDDERAIRSTMKEILEHEKYKVDVSADVPAAMEMLKTNSYDVVFADICMPGLDGTYLLSHIHEHTPEVPVIMFSAFGNIETAVDCIKRGAYDFIEKPLDISRLLLAVRNALEKKSLVTETKTLKKRIEKQYEMIGETEPIIKLRDIIEKVGKTDARVLITGANGTGKEIVARQLYYMSSRSTKPFIEVNCAAIPSELIESELFGHDKGAFTSAVKQRSGKFEQANGGTIFLDEIGDMSLSAQSKVLRCLQENVITPVGSDKQIKIDVRVLAATNKDLKSEIEAGNFREDLYHRINVIPIEVASLDERRDDIPLLVDHFVNLICTEQRISIKHFEVDAIEALKQRKWRGNVRELRNVVERLIILSGKTITLENVKEYA